MLSGVLIITAFLSIIGGALMTELTTGFLLSRVLVNRVNAQATVNSAAELALDQLQATARDVQCPALDPALLLNGRSAAVTYLSCALVPDSQWPVAPVPLSFAPFSIDGARVQLSTPYRDAYLVADKGGRVTEFNFGQAWPRPGWPVNLGGSVSGPPMAMLDQLFSPPGITTLVPMLDHGSPSCMPARHCVAALSEYPPSGPTIECFMSSTGRVTSAPAAARRITNLAYFGDDAGNLYAYTTGGGGGGGDGDGQHGGGSGSSCSLRSMVTLPGSQPVKGVFALWGANPYTDEVFVLGDSKLVRYTFSPSGFSTAVAALPLPWAGAVGLARDSSSAFAPTRLAITFGGGAVAIVQITGGYGMSLLATKGLAAPITSAPYWCGSACGDMIGVGLSNGNLNVLNAVLSSLWTYPGTAAISSTPAADAAGDWFFGAADGVFYEVHPPPAGGAAMTLAAAIILGERTGSSPVIDRCATGICVHLGTLSGHSFMIPFDARSVTLTACINTPAPACSNDSPKLWVSAEVGYMNNQRTVRVRGWSYYSG